jgi:general stress protein YciG
MDPEERREISRRGGEASHLSGRGHEFTPEEAREAGRLGGEARWGRAAASKSGGRGSSNSGAEEDPARFLEPELKPRTERDEEGLEEDRGRRARGRRSRSD